MTPPDGVKPPTTSEKTRAGNVPAEKALDSMVTPPGSAEGQSQLAAQLVTILFAARDAAHILHLGTKSYSEHMALDGFYNDIIPLADSFAEIYQGKNGLLTYQDFKVQTPKSSTELMSTLYSWIKTNRYNISSDSNIQNTIDEIVSLISQTNYKLENLH